MPQGHEMNAILVLLFALICIVADLLFSGSKNSAGSKS
jgi:hypothetical protein